MMARCTGVGWRNPNLRQVCTRGGQRPNSANVDAADEDGGMDVDGEAMGTDGASFSDVSGSFACWLVPSCNNAPVIWACLRFAVLEKRLDMTLD